MATDLRPTCNSPSALVPMAADLHRLDSTQLWSGKAILLPIDQGSHQWWGLICWSNQMCLRRRRREPSCISLRPFANDVSVQFIWEIKQNQTWQKHVHAHQISGYRQLLCLLHILLSIGRVDQGHIVRKWRFQFLQLLSANSRSNPQLQWAISRPTIIFVGHLIDLSDSPRLI